MPYTDDICQQEDNHSYAQRKIQEFLREERENRANSIRSTIEKK